MIEKAQRAKSDSPVKSELQEDRASFHCSLPSRTPSTEDRAGHLMCLCNEIRFLNLMLTKKCRSMEQGEMAKLEHPVMGLVRVRRGGSLAGSVLAWLGPLGFTLCIWWNYPETSLTAQSVLLWTVTRMSSLCVRISTVILSRGLATSTSDEGGLLSSPTALLLGVHPGEFLTQVH